MKILEKVREAAEGARQAVATVQRSVVEFRQQIADKSTALQHAEAAPRPPDEVVAAFNRWVDEIAGYQAKRHGTSLVGSFGAPPGRTGAGAKWGTDTAVEWGWLCLFAGPELKSRFAALVTASEYEPGPAEADRPGVIARLKRELEALEGEEERLIDEAAAAGVAISHRPETLERRETEARRREREARESAARSARRVDEYPVVAHRRS